MASMKIAALLAISLLALQQPYGYCAGKPQCKGNPKVIAACYVVHGRLNLGADTITLRLWAVGTNRMLGISNGPDIDDAEYPIYPKNMELPLDDKTVFGDFEVCPFTPARKDAMRFVCIESATHIVVKHE
jgi:hypothetical protein